MNGIPNAMTMQDALKQSFARLMSLRDGVTEKLSRDHAMQSYVKAREVWSRSDPQEPTPAGRPEASGAGFWRSKGAGTE